MNTKLKTATPALLAAATLFLAACGSDEKPAQATPPATTAPAVASSTADSTTSGSPTTESSTTE
ncbi:hypothetical protein ABLG96_20285 [Nakamurella sp. A5-74]|uniref:Uncharacterized protein n=1 Tax=Nakamurella sp. A5-74 TaxID=3158264 RepID=A0AAU8DRL5_9ACTN